MRTTFLTAGISLPDGTEQDAYPLEAGRWDSVGRRGLRPRPHITRLGPHITQLLIKRGNCLLEHSLVRGCGGAAEVLPCTCPCQFQCAAALLKETVLRRHRWPLAPFLSRCFLLLGFHRFRLKTSGHAFIVRCPGWFERMTAALSWTQRIVFNVQL
jgi:hypothetical protein